MADSATKFTTRRIATNGIELSVTEAGEGPLVVLCHGFPELAYSWRHQIAALADAGYHVLAPDQRGYGASDAPAEIEAYDIVTLTDDLLGLVDAVGEDGAVFIGHDWGSNLVWHLSVRVPERVRAVVGMSVPFLPRSAMPPISMMKQLFGDNFFYILYFQEPGVADANLGADPDRTMRGMLAGLGGDADFASLAATAAAVSDPDAGFVERLPRPEKLPDWLSEGELAHYVDTFGTTGFSGGINWYRNFDRNWELTESLAETKVEMPALFITGANDPVALMTPPELMDGWVTDLRGVIRVPDAGHWVQQEKPAATNAALRTFLDALPG